MITASEAKKSIETLIDNSDMMKRINDEILKACANYEPDIEIELDVSNLDLLNGVFKRLKYYGYYTDKLYKVTDTTYKYFISWGD